MVKIDKLKRDETAMLSQIFHQFEKQLNRDGENIEQEMFLLLFLMQSFGLLEWLNRES